MRRRRGRRGLREAERLQRERGIETQNDHVELALTELRRISPVQESVSAARPFVFSLLPVCHGLCGSQK